jgi:hypothetical protein
LWELSCPASRNPAPSRGLAAKQIQEKPNKSKQNRLDLLGFIRPNQGFSMGYSESK